jgi:hypothetical protein
MAAVASTANPIEETGARPMPYRIILLWHLAGCRWPQCVTTGAVMMLAAVAEGWSQVALWSLWIGSGFLAVWLAAPLGKGIEILTRALAGGISLMFKSLADAVDAWAKAKRALVSGLAEAKAEVAEVRAEVKINSLAISETDRKAEEARQNAAEAERKAVEEAKRLAKDAADKRHDLRDAMTAENSQLRLEVWEARDEIASLKARLGITDATHADAINTVASDVKTIAEKLDPPVEVHETRVEAGRPNGGLNS